ncbi:hypothetical protein TNCV_2978161 [Trichonephila clavipes]|nr:hypothetical protein TNCV_2978161 [Trichonephila clavipes]
MPPRRNKEKSNNLRSLNGGGVSAFEKEDFPIAQCYAGEHCLPEWVIERHSSLILWLWFGVRFRIMDDPICYELRVITIATAQHMQLLSWLAYSPDMLPIDYVRDLVGRRLARDPCPAASKDELLLRIQAMWNSLPQTDIQNLFDSIPRYLALLIAVRGGYTKY